MPDLVRIMRVLLHLLMLSTVGMANGTAVRMGHMMSTQAAAHHCLLDSSCIIKCLHSFENVSAYTYILNFKHLQ